MIKNQDIKKGRSQWYLAYEKWDSHSRLQAAVRLPWSNFFVFNKKYKGSPKVNPDKNLDNNLVSQILRVRQDRATFVIDSN